MQKKILYFIPRFTTGGAERLVLQYARHFKNVGFEVAVASVVGGGELVKEFEKAGIEILVGRKSGVCNFYKNYTEIKQKFKPNIIHSHVFSADVMGFLFKRQDNEWISTQHNVGDEHSWLRLQVLKIILKKADKVVAVSHKVYDFCVNDLHLNKNNVQVIKNGIDTDKWLAVDTELFKENKIKLAIVGRLEKQKNHEFLLRALADFDKDWELNIYGEGCLEKSLKQLSKTLKIDKNIKWIGVKSDMPVELTKIDIVIQPSFWEGMSLVIMEAMATGRLVVASEPAGYGLVEDGKTGFIIKNFNEDELVKILNKIIVQKDLAIKITNSARNFAKNNFDISAHLTKLEKIYNEY